MEADPSGHGGGASEADAARPPNRPAPATGRFGAPAQVLTFAPRQSYRQHAGGWLIEADDAFDGDEHGGTDVDG